MQEAKPSLSLITLSWAHSRRLHRLPVPAVRRAVPPPVSRLMDANDARGASPPPHAHTLRRPCHAGKMGKGKALCDYSITLRCSC
jgi:hypothetical protein